MFYFISHLLESLRRRRTTARVRRPERRTRLFLERLEDRLAPAAMNITVNTLNDDPNGPVVGQTTLRDAINTANIPANAGSTITFKANLRGTIQLAAALPMLSQNMTIQGTGYLNLGVSGMGAQNPFNIFTINRGISCEIDNLRLDPCLERRSIWRLRQ